MEGGLFTLQSQADQPFGRMLSSVRRTLGGVQIGGYRMASVAGP
jgi:hypothetical protein